ncbi:uncharacterized protein GGS25DRAFT_28867 [Hypoxylon fragiforme]|uniref:uncharacterized protein n=1 Tax=Hypoxylon fragiforme TaxID=63214 RepID=UPI0020C66856|nr:uncharacterized protein GGS25DRAFT_28867 [Hypoxylon fragiforme]KAI2613995.1 hypothetical protein GGS25DRAFT_28867 [Hypoxylon fragiforme]
MKRQFLISLVLSIFSVFLKILDSGGDIHKLQRSNVQVVTRTIHYASSCLLPLQDPLLHHMKAKKRECERASGEVRW